MSAHTAPPRDAKIASGPKGLSATGAGRVGLIDSFRGLAILSVLAFHFTVAMTPPLYPVDTFHFAHPFPGWIEAGRYGVHVFFIISGLVIAQTLLRSKSTLDFFWKRFARLYPAFLGALTLAFVLVAVLGPPFGPAAFVDYLANLTLAAPDLGRPWIDAVYWSLLVEIEFYLIAGLALAVLGRNFWAGVVGFAFLAAAVAHFRSYGAHAWMISDDLPFFLFGIAAWFWCFEQRRKPAAICLASAAVLFAYYNLGFPRVCSFQGACLHIAPDGFAFGYLFGVGGGLLALLALGVRKGWAPLSFVGRISYSIYLVHSLLGLLVIRTLKGLGAPDLLALSVATIVAIAAGWIMFRTVEEPGHKLLLGLRRRWRAGRRGTVAAA